LRSASVFVSQFWPPSSERGGRVSTPVPDCLLLLRKRPPPPGAAGCRMTHRPTEFSRPRPFSNQRTCDAVEGGRPDCLLFKIGQATERAAFKARFSFLAGAGRRADRIAGPALWAEVSKIYRVQPATASTVASDSTTLSLRRSRSIRFNESPDETRVPIRR
jgi:hypothetical protein